MQSHPNILFIIADQHNAKVLGHQGHPQVKTPNLDRLAAGGTRFDNAICQNPICTPSRVSFLSGQYCHNHGYYGLSGPNPRGLPSLFGHFRQAGYTTSAVGKIHCPEYWVEDDTDVFHETCDCSVGGRSAEYAAFLRERGKLELEDHIRLTEFGPRGQQSMEGRPSALTYEESQEGWIAGKTIAFMRDAHAQGKPFLAFASLPRPHQCTAPSEPFWSLYEDVDLTLPPNADYDLEAAGKAPHLRRSAEHWRRGDWTLIEPRTFEAGRLRKLRGYLGAVSQVDHAVGQMVDFLDEAGIADETIVIYTSDHGDYACEHGVMEKAPGICSDAITRIPFIWRVPGMADRGQVVEHLVEAVDVSTTLVSLCGLDPMLTSDGHDITSLLRGEDEAVRDVAVTEFAMSKSLRSGKWRLVYYPPAMFEDTPAYGELYNLEDDPWEMQNLYFDEQHRDVIHCLERQLLDWLVLTTRPVTGLGVNHLPATQSTTRYKCPTLRDGKLPPPAHLSTGHINYS